MSSENHQKGLQVCFCAFNQDNLEYIPYKLFYPSRKLVKLAIIPLKPSVFLWLPLTPIYSFQDPSFGFGSNVLQPLVKKTSI